MEEWKFSARLMEDDGELDVEKLLLIRMGSQNKSIAELAANKLYYAYVFGSFVFGDEQMEKKEYSA